MSNTGQEKTMDEALDELIHVCGNDQEAITDRFLELGNAGELSNYQSVLLDQLGNVSRTLQSIQMELCQARRDRDKSGHA